MFVELINKLKLTVLEFLALFSLIVFLIFPLQYMRKEHWEAIFVQTNRLILNMSKRKMWASLFMIIFMTSQHLTHEKPSNTTYATNKQIPLPLSFLVLGRSLADFEY